jgi:hypothetical protein
MRYYPGLVKMAGYVHPKRMTIALLFFTAENANFLEDLDKYGGPPADIVGPNVLNAWHFRFPSRRAQAGANSEWEFAARGGLDGADFV